MMFMLGGFEGLCCSFGASRGCSNPESCLSAPFVYWYNGGASFRLQGCSGTSELWDSVPERRIGNVEHGSELRGLSCFGRCFGAICPTSRRCDGRGAAALKRHCITPGVASSCKTACGGRDGGLGLHGCGISCRMEEHRARLRGWTTGVVRTGRGHRGQATGAA